MTESSTWRTPLTELFGMRYPILAGGLMWLSDASYVGALVRAGAMAFMTPRSFESIEEFEHQLRSCSDHCGRLPFGVNLTVSGREEANTVIPRQLEVALAHGVRHFETVGPSPGPLFDRIHAAGGVVIHKCAFLEHALKAERAGADAIALVGMEAGGHPGMNPLPASMLCAFALDHLQRPLAWGGGIGHGRQIAAALALGCGGVVIGTRFLVGDEVSAHPAYKNYLLQQEATASTVVLRSTGNPWRVLDNETAAKVRLREAEGASRYDDYGSMAQGRTGRDGAYVSGNPQLGLLSMGPSIGFARERAPLARNVSDLMEQTHAALLSAASLLPTRSSEVVL